MHTIHYLTLCTCISDGSNIRTNYSTKKLFNIQQPGNVQLICSLVVPYFSQSLGAWAPLPNTSTTLSHHSRPRHGCWCPTHPLRGVLFKQSCIQNKLHSMYYSTCTVKPLTPPTCVSFKLFNVLCVYVLCV